jgi:hypothetical protein
VRKVEAEMLRVADTGRGAAGRDPAGVDDDPVRAVETFAGPKPSGPTSTRKSTQWAAVSTTFGRISVPEQKSNQSFPFTVPCSTPAFANLLAVSEVPPTTAPAGATTSRRHTAAAASRADH